MRVPVDADNYAGVSAVEGHLVYATTPAFFYGPISGGDTTLHIYSLEDREASELLANFQGGAFSEDRKKLLARASGGFKLYDVKPGGGKPTSVSTSGLEMDHDPAAEWEAIFNETWRLFRDYFYVENMHGYDWQALGEQYRAWLPHVAHRYDLNYVLTEMVSELNAGHTYISGGDFEIPDRPGVALPGARFELDERVGRRPRHRA